MANLNNTRKRFPHAGIFLIIAIALSIPLTIWSMNNVPTETRSRASTGYFECSSGNYISCLSSQFNVTLVGTSNQTKAKILFEILNIPLSYSKFYAEFRSIGIKITVSSLAQSSGGAWAITDNTGNITLYKNFFDASQLVKKQYLIHEAAHTFSRTSTGNSLQSSLYSNVYKKGLDTSCFKSGPLIKTFPFSTAGNYVHEVFAESVADTLVCASGASCGDWGTSSKIINSFPSTCKNTYIFVKNNILGQPLSVSSAR